MKRKPRKVKYNLRYLGKLKLVPSEPVGHYFSGRVFWWDVNPDKLDYRLDADFIISRVLARMFVKDGNRYFKKLERVYPMKAIKFFALQSVEIRGNERIEVIGKRYWLKKEKLKNWVGLKYFNKF